MLEICRPMGLKEFNLNNHPKTCFFSVSILKPSSDSFWLMKCPKPIENIKRILEANKDIGIVKYYPLIRRESLLIDIDLVEYS